MSNLPAVIESREAAQQALAAGDSRAANAAYSRELQALHDVAPAASVSTEIALPSATPSEIDGAIAIYRQWDPDGMQALERAWAGDITANLNYAEFVAQRYQIPAQQLAAITPTADLLRIAATVGRGVAGDIRDGNSLGTLPAVTQQQESDFLDTFEPDERAGIQASVTDFRAALSAAAGIIQRYLRSVQDRIPDDAGFWRAGLPAALKITADLNARKGTTMTDTSLDPIGEEYFADALDELRAKQQALMERGEHRRANALYQREQELLASKHGARPAIGHAGRTA